MTNQAQAPFEHGPDPELGAALRAALQPRDQAAFVARVVAAFDTAGIPTWELLVRWGRRGLAVAAAAAIVAVVLGRLFRAPASLDEAFAAAMDPAASATTALLLADRPPDPGAVFAAVVGAER